MLASSVYFSRTDLSQRPIYRLPKIIHAKWLAEQFGGAVTQELIRLLGVHQVRCTVRSEFAATARGSGGNWRAPLHAESSDRE